MEVWEAIFIVIGTIVTTLVYSWAVRRILGVSVGWTRTIALSALGVLIIVPVLPDVITAWAGVSIDDLIEAQSPDIAAFMGIYVLAGAWVFVLEIVVLTLMELMVPTGSVPGPIEWARAWPARWRRSRRYAQIMQIATKHGLGSFLRRFRTPSRLQRGDVVAAHLREALSEGGVTFVKLGQTLATRADLLPEPFVRELSALHSDVSPQPWSLVEEQITAQLGRPIDEVFASVDHEPLAAASVAQVHSAVLLSGERVVIKIQRAAAAKQVNADLDIVLRLADWVELRTSWGRQIGARALASGFARSLGEELDYRIEVSNMEAIGRQGTLVVPRVWHEYSSARMIVMEHVSGQPLSRAGDELAALDADERESLANHLFDAVLQQILVVGVFHADLHPGNIVLSKAPDGSPQLSLLDFGSVGRLGRSTREAMAVLLAALDRQDALTAADAVIEILGRPARLDDRALEGALSLLIMGDSGAALFEGLLHVVVRQGFTVPANVAAAFRGVVTLEGSLQLIDPSFDLMVASRRAGERLKAELVSPEQVRGRLEEHLSSLLPMLQRLPRRLDRITADLEAGRFTVGVRALASDVDRGFVTGLVREATTALLTVALAVCGVLLLVAPPGQLLLGRITVNGVLGWTFLLFAFVLGARLLAISFRSARR